MNCINAIPDSELPDGFEAAIDLVEVGEIVAGPHWEHLRQGFWTAFVVVAGAVHFLGRYSLPQCEVAFPERGKRFHQLCWISAVVPLPRHPQILIRADDRRIVLG